jgi:peptide/nickel transport system ATP-binding protein/oligopeptide transport system ATP-binding protein
LLIVRDLVKHYHPHGFLRPRAPVRAVDGVSFEVSHGETLALVGETGSGKSTLARTILRLEPATSGSVLFEGHDLLTLSSRPLRALRRRMQIVFQDPSGALNPRMTVGAAIAEGLEIHRLLPRAEIPGRVTSLMEEVGLDPEAATRYPREFSGGQRQRVGIARALAVGPAFLILDEPVSALDVSVQAQVLNLLLDLQQRRDLAFLFIAHDLAVVRQVAHRVAVMYLGRIVETGPTDEVLTRPRHPYTKALLSAAPEPDPQSARTRILLPGEPPDPSHPPAGCRFNPRCPHPDKDNRCVSQEPLLRRLGQADVACHYATVD